uniref:Uncharacterized protein n=1 Tax=Arundo donax TaxID=35708 RepID=A0A0A9AAU7_ARUDO
MNAVTPKQELPLV